MKNIKLETDQKSFYDRNQISILSQISAKMKMKLSQVKFNVINICSTWVTEPGSVIFFLCSFILYFNEGNKFLFISI